MLSKSLILLQLDIHFLLPDDFIISSVNIDDSEWDVIENMVWFLPWGTNGCSDDIIVWQSYSWVLHITYTIALVQGHLPVVDLVILTSFECSNITKEETVPVTSSLEIKQWIHFKHCVLLKPVMDIMFRHALEM